MVIIHEKGFGVYNSGVSYIYIELRVSLGKPVVRQPELIIH